MPSYSADISSAWEALDNLDLYYAVMNSVNNRGEKEFVCDIVTDMGNYITVRATAPTAPEAICKAVLLTVLWGE